MTFHYVHLFGLVSAYLRVIHICILVECFFEDMVWIERIFVVNKVPVDGQSVHGITNKGHAGLQKG